MVVVAGYLTQDIVVRTQRDPMVTDFSPGMITLSVGGSGANVAAWLAWVGQESELVGVAGAEPAADALIDGFSRSGATCTVRRAGTSPIVASIVDSAGERHLVLDAGGPFSLVDFPAPITSPTWLHIPGFCVYRDDLRAQTVRLAEEIGTTARISADICSAHLVGVFGIDRMVRLLSGLDVEVLFLNEGEADAMGRHGALERLAPQVVVHRGASSSQFSFGGRWEETAAGIVPETTPVDPTGAGDAFAAGYIARAVHGSEPRVSVAYGPKIAQVAIRTPGGQPPGKR